MIKPPALPESLRYLVVEGIPGVGKSELAEKLARRLGMQLLLEDFEENPYLERFYFDPVRWAFQTQLAYLASRYRQLSKLHNLDLFHTAVVADYSLDKDRIFAQLYLKGDDLRLFETLFLQMARYIPKPNLVLYLQSTVENSIENIRIRGRTYESGINSLQLARLRHAYTEYFLRYTKSPVLIVSAEELNSENNEAHMDELIRQIAKESHHGVTYFKSSRSRTEPDLYSHEALSTDD